MGISDEDVLDIYHKINTYMNIVKTTIRDMVPKAITLYIIRHLEKYISTDLLMEILNVPEDTYVRGFRFFYGLQITVLLWENISYFRKTCLRLIRKARLNTRKLRKCIKRVRLHCRKLSAYKTTI